MAEYCGLFGMYILLLFMAMEYKTNGKPQQLTIWTDNKEVLAWVQKAKKDTWKITKFSSSTNDFATAHNHYM